MLRHSSFILWSNMKMLNLNIHEFLMKTLEMNEKLQKIKGCTYKITHILVPKCPRVPNLVLN